MDQKGENDCNKNVVGLMLEENLWSQILSFGRAKETMLGRRYIIKV